MKKDLFKYSLTGFVFVSVFGTLMHFLYEWSGCNTAVGLFAPINESTWEHLKMIFFPYLIWSIAEYIMLKKQKGVFSAKFIGVFTGIAAIVVFFYTYTGIFGKSIEILNILSFFIGVFAAFLTDYMIIKSEKLSSIRCDTIFIAAFIIVGALFVIFTVAPPFIPLFKDPINSTYGI